MSHGRNNKSFTFIRSHHCPFWDFLIDFEIWTEKIWVIFEKKILNIFQIRRLEAKYTTLSTAAKQERKLKFH